MDAMRASGLLLHWELPLGMQSVGFNYFSSQLCCPLRFQDYWQTSQWEGFSVFGNFFSFMTPSLGWIFVPNSFVPLLIFYILSYLLSKRLGCLSGCLVSSASIQKLFVEVAQHSNDLLVNLLGGKVVSLSCFSAISGLPPRDTTLDWVIREDFRRGRVLSQNV